MKKILIIKGLSIFTPEFVMSFLQQHKITDGTDIEEVRVARFGDQRWVFLQFMSREACDESWSKCENVRVPGVVFQHSWRQFEQRVLHSQGYPNGQRAYPGLRKWTWKPRNPSAC